MKQALQTASLAVTALVYSGVSLAQEAGTAAAIDYTPATNFITWEGVVPMVLGVAGGSMTLTLAYVGIKYVRRVLKSA